MNFCLGRRFDADASCLLISDSHLWNWECLKCRQRICQEDCQEVFQPWCWRVHADSADLELVVRAQIATGSWSALWGLLVMLDAGSIPSTSRWAVGGIADLGDRPRAHSLDSVYGSHPIQTFGSLLYSGYVWIWYQKSSLWRHLVHVETILKIWDWTCLQNVSVSSVQFFQMRIWVLGLEAVFVFG